MGDYYKFNQSYCKHLPPIKVTVEPNFQTQTLVDTYFSYENNTTQTSSSSGGRLV